MRRSIADGFFSTGRRLRGVLRRFPFLHRGSMMSNNAAHRRTGHRMVSRHMADSPADRSAFYTTVGIGDDGKSGDCNRHAAPLRTGPYIPVAAFAGTRLTLALAFPCANPESPTPGGGSSQS